MGGAPWALGVELRGEVRWRRQPGGISMWLGLKLGNRRSPARKQWERRAEAANAWSSGVRRGVSRDHDGAAGGREEPGVGPEGKCRKYHLCQQHGRQAPGGSAGVLTCDLEESRG